MISLTTMCSIRVNQPTYFTKKLPFVGDGLSRILSVQRSLFIFHKMCAQSFGLLFILSQLVCCFVLNSPFLPNTLSTSWVNYLNALCMHEEDVCRWVCVCVFGQFLQENTGTSIEHSGSAKQCRVSTQSSGNLSNIPFRPKICIIQSHSPFLFSPNFHEKCRVNVCVSWISRFSVYLFI